MIRNILFVLIALSMGSEANSEAVIGIDGILYGNICEYDGIKVFMVGFEPIGSPCEIYTESGASFTGVVVAN